MVNLIQTIGLIGSTGNLGKVVYNQLIENGFKVELIGRNFSESNNGRLIPFENIEFRRDQKIDLVINLSNYYTPMPKGEDFERMKDSILGVAEAIAKFNKGKNVPIVSASTYFQYCPNTLQPWSLYSELKSEAQYVLTQHAIDMNFCFSDFVLFDNYGGGRKDKFLDIAIKSINATSPIPATFGEQVVNLAHVCDISSAIVNESKKLLSCREPIIQFFDLRSDETFTLREIARLIETIAGKRPNIRWGALPYREKEVFQLWTTGLERPAGWVPQERVSDYISDVASEQ